MLIYVNKLEVGSSVVQIDLVLRDKKSGHLLTFHLKIAQVQNGRPDGNRAPQAPTDAPMRPLGSVSLIHDNKPDHGKAGPTRIHCCFIFFKYQPNVQTQLREERHKPQETELASPCSM